MTGATSPVELATRLEACTARLAEKQPVCPFSRRSPEYLTTDPDKPCHYCGTTQEGPDMCRGIGSDVLDKTEDALRAAAFLLRDMSEREKWQPIETAPKDGSTIILWGKYHSEPVTAAWAPRGKWASRWDGVTVIEAQGDTYTDYAEPTAPTHWRPLPAPPVEGK